MAVWAHDKKRAEARTDSGAAVRLIMGGSYAWGQHQTLLNLTVRSAAFLGICELVMVIPTAKSQHCHSVLLFSETTHQA